MLFYSIRTTVMALCLLTVIQLTSRFCIQGVPGIFNIILVFECGESLRERKSAMFPVPIQLQLMAVQDIRVSYSISHFKAVATVFGCWLSISPDFHTRLLHTQLTQHYLCIAKHVRFQSFQMVKITNSNQYFHRDRLLQSLREIFERSSVL